LVTNGNDILAYSRLSYVIGDDQKKRAGDERGLGEKRRGRESLQALLLLLLLLLFFKKNLIPVYQSLIYAVIGYF